MRIIVMKKTNKTSKRRVIASVLSLLMVLQQSATYQAAASVITNVNDIPLKKDDGVFNITPDMVNKATKTGFRKFNNFQLDKGDVANFIFRMYNTRAQNYSADKSGNTTNPYVETITDIDTFIAAVNSGKVKIDGIVNALTALPNRAHASGTEAGT